MHVLVDAVTGMDDEGAIYVQSLVRGLTSADPQPTWTVFARPRHRDLFEELCGDRFRVFPVEGPRVLWKEWGVRRYMRTGREVLLAPRNGASLLWSGPQLLVVSDLAPLSSAFRVGAGAGLAAPFRRVRLAASLRRVDLAVAHGAHAMKLLGKGGFFVDRTKVMSPGVEEVFFVDGQGGGGPRSPPRRRSYVLSPGPVMRRKRIEAQLQALALVRNEGSDLGLCVLGPVSDPSYRRRLEDEAGHLGVGDLLEFREARTLEDEATMYREAEALVLTSEAEDFPVPVVKGMASGIPVITADSVETRELCGELARSVPAGDAAALASVLGEALDGGELRERAWTVGPPMARPYAWSRMGRDWIWLLRAAVARKFGRPTPDPDTVPEALVEGDEPTVPMNPDAATQKELSTPPDRRSRRR